MDVVNFCSINSFNYFCFLKMKRLLLPLLAALALPTAVNAFPFGGDIVVKTDFGEKYIIKESSINLLEEEKIQDTLNFKEQEIEEVKESIAWQKSSTSMDREYLAICEKNPKDIICGSVDLFKETIEVSDETLKRLTKRLQKYQNDISILNKSNKDLIKKKISFRPIIEDLNNQKKISDENFVWCINPKLNKLSKEILTNDNFYRKNISEEKSKLIPYEEIQKKICDKYAKF